MQLVVPIHDQGAGLFLLWSVKPFQGHGQEIGAAVDALFIPGGDQLRSLNLCQQLKCQGGAVVDHDHQPEGDLRGLGEADH